MKLNKKGFTLLEVIAVVTILGVGLVSILSLANYVVYVPEISANRMVAAALAQQALEDLRFNRDTNWANNVIWNNTLCSAGIPYSKTLNGIAFNVTFVGTCNLTDIVDISVSVDWMWRGQNYTFGPMKTTLYNWFKQ